MENLQICVYKDTIVEHDESSNLSLVTVNKDFVVQYLKECKDGVFKDIEDFLDTYTADDTEDFYEYAVKHNAVVEVEDW